MRVIRASEIGSFIYCQRAWWYLRTGHAPDNIAEIQGGSKLHNRHGRGVLVTGFLRFTAYALILLSLILLVVDTMSQMF
jgi:hypothetical protein